MSAPLPTLAGPGSLDEIRSRPCPACYLCGSAGVMLHEGLTDRLFGAFGVWNFKRCSNPACGLLWLDPMPLEDDIAKAYLSYYTHEDALPAPNGNPVRWIYSRIRDSYLRSKYDYRCVRRSRWDQLLAHLLYLDPPRREMLDLSAFWLRSKPNGRLLEVGCGSGSTLKMMKELGWRVQGVDFDPTAVEQARRKGLDVRLGTLEEQKLPKNSFDAIAARHVIEHVPNPIGLLRECRRLLKPDGLLVLVTPNAESWGHRLYQRDWRGLEPPRHLHIFTRSSLMAASTQAGFNVSDCHSIVRASTILLESRMLRRDGKVDSTRHTRWRIRLWSEATALFQYAVSFVDAEAGEELMLVSAR